MVMDRIKWILTGWLLLSSCSSEDRMPVNEAEQEGVDSVEAVQEEPMRENYDSDTIAFEEAFSLFFAALQTSDTTTLNRFIAPSHGLWVIEQPGAMPKMTRVTDIRHFRREFEGRSFFTVRNEVKDCYLEEAEWPTFDCADMDYDKGRSGYSKDGCFVWHPGKFTNSGYWNYASLSESEIQTIKESLPFVQRSVLHTATSFEFHFGFIDGHWRLLFSKLIYPCSA